MAATLKSTIDGLLKTAQETLYEKVKEEGKEETDRLRTSHGNYFAALERQCQQVAGFARHLTFPEEYQAAINITGYLLAFTDPEVWGRVLNGNAEDFRNLYAPLLAEVAPIRKAAVRLTEALQEEMNHRFPINHQGTSTTYSK